MSEERIIITPDKVVRRIWNGETRKYRRKIINPKNLPFYCWEDVSIEGDVSLGRLISLLEASRKRWEVLLCENIGPFLEESHNPAIKKDDMAFLELCWEAETTIYKGETDFYLWPCFHGVGYATEDDEHGMYKKGERVPYAIEMTPVNELVHYSVRLDESVNVIHDDLDDFDTTGKYSQKETALGKKAFTLLELFKGIFWEITFLGSPEARDEEMQNIRETAEGVRDGSIETIPWEEVKEKEA